MSKETPSKRISPAGVASQIKPSGVCAIELMTREGRPSRTDQVSRRSCESGRFASTAYTLPGTQSHSRQRIVAAVVDNHPRLYLRSILVTQRRAQKLVPVCTAALFIVGKFHENHEDLGEAGCG